MIASPAEIHYFLEIANTLNLSRAAERLGISQPTLTLAVKRLEGAFGLPLLVRSKSGVRLTQAGQRLVSNGRNLLEEWERVRSEAVKDENELRGRYIVGCHPSVALYALPSVLPTLLSENPQLEIKLVHDLSRRITEEVISFRIDFGLVINPWEHPDLVIKPLGTDEVRLWTSKNPSPMQNPKSEDAVLICDPDLAQSQSILKQLSKHGLQFRRVLTTNNLEVVTGLVAARVGLGVLPGKVATHTKSLGLKPFSPSPTFHDKLCLVYRADSQRSKASRRLGARIAELFRPEGQ